MVSKKNAPIYIEIYRSIKKEILTNIRKPGDKLVSIRLYAKSLNVSVNTIKKAYTRLAEEGYISCKARSRYVVTDITTYHKNPNSVQDSSNSFCLTQDMYPISPIDYKYDFAYHKMSLNLIQPSHWRKYVDEALLGYDQDKLGKYTATKGEFELQKK